MDESNNELYNERYEKIWGFINSEQYTPMLPRDIAMLLDIHSGDIQMLYDIIEDMEQNGKIVLTKKGKIMLPADQNLYTGTFTGNTRGFGFVTREDSPFAEDIFIPAAMTNGAIHRDKVMCRITAQNGRHAEGEIVKIIERGMHSIVGTFEQSKGFGFVIPDDKKLADDIFISKTNTMGAVSGHKVVAMIIKNGTDNSKPEGKITEIIGHINDPGVDIVSIIRQFELPMEFDENVYKFIENIPLEVSGDELAGRSDYRNVQMVTIDGEDAKDLDDAVSVEKTENGTYRLGVYIADVSHYVTQGSPLDKAAYERGTSVYLVDRVIPMLPHKLSNGICSLNAGEDRLCLCCIMELDTAGTVLSQKIERAVINVDRRMSYTVVNSLLCDENSPYTEEYAELLPQFRLMAELRDILFEKRRKRGAIEFESREAKIILDENGKPVDIKPYERNLATSIIEEFMLAANECIAEYYFWLELPFVFRNHEEPDDEKVEKLREILGGLGYYLKGSATHPKSFQKLLAQTKDKPEEMLIHRMVLRSLKQARYSPENGGHFGLAAKYYCHFTSPIRRYPDLQIHRIISKNIEGTLTENDIHYLDKNLPEITSHCSMTERRAEDAERETDKYKMVEYMSDKVGQCFDGIISSVVSWGIYVELPNTVEGMVALKNLTDDRYIFDEEHMLYLGEHTHKEYKIGESVRVKLISASLVTRTIDFEFTEE